MNILYVLARPVEINSSASIRNLATINGLVESGHQITLVCSDYDKRHNNYDGNLTSKAQIIEYMKITKEQKINSIGRNIQILKPIRKIAYNLKMTLNLYGDYTAFPNFFTEYIDKISDYDLIISSSDPKSSHLFVEKLLDNTSKHIPWIQIWGDPFFLDITRKSNQKNGKKIKREEERLISKADKIIYVSPLTLRDQKEVYPLYREKMKSVLIPFAEEKIYDKEIVDKESLTFLYSGDYSKSTRDIFPIYEAIRTTNHKLIICGSSDLELLETENIKIYPRVGFKKLKELEEKSDVLVHLSNSHGNQIPGKIYQYSGTNKLILFLLDGNKKELFEIFSKYNRYIMATNEKESIISEIVKIQKGEFDDTRFVLDELSPNKIAKEIVSI